MRRFTVRLSLFMFLVLFATARAARADVCVAIDEARDTFSPQDRVAAVLLVGNQFARAGERVAPEGCSMPYTVSHVVLGNTIVVTLSGPNGRREGTALGMDDLPALYSQMVRSMMMGRPMTGFNVVDRTNVTASQASSPQRVQSDQFWYSRLGYGATFGDKGYGGPALGFGYRLEFDSLGVDVSFLNFQFKEPDAGYYDSSNGAFSGSVLKLEGLYFVNPVANATAYVGGGAAGAAPTSGATGTGAVCRVS